MLEKIYAGFVDGLHKTCEGNEKTKIFILINQLDYRPIYLNGKIWEETHLGVGY
jgi:hypothetical protein